MGPGEVRDLSLHRLSEYRHGQATYLFHANLSICSFPVSLHFSIDVAGEGLCAVSASLPGSPHLSEELQGLLSTYASLACMLTSPQARHKDPPP